jgi:hypothetical protein
MHPGAVAMLAVLAMPICANAQQSAPQPWRIDRDGGGYRVLYPDGEFTQVMPCGNSLCISSTDESLPTPPILPIGPLNTDPFADSRTDLNPLP